MNAIEKIKLKINKIRNDSDSKSMDQSFGLYHLNCTFKLERTFKLKTP